MSKANTSFYVIKHSVSANNQDMPARGHWVPNADVYVTEGSLVIKVELAGMRREDLELTVDANRLVISGQRPDGCRAPKCKFLVMEINYGSFECTIQIPPGYDLPRAVAAYQNGFLRVDVPQLPGSTGKHSLKVGPHAG